MTPLPHARARDLSGRRPRVLHFITHLALGGAERVVFHIMDGLRDAYDFGLFAACRVSPDAIGHSMRRDLERLAVPLFLGTNVPIKRGGMLLAGLRAAGAMGRHAPDIVHVHTEIPEASYAAMVTLRPDLGRIPLVRTIQNSLYWHSWRRLGRWCDRRMAHSYLACVSDAAKEAALRLRNESRAGPFPADSPIIFNGVMVRSAPRPFERAPGAEVRILFAGRFEDQKGADLLPRILRQTQLRDCRPSRLVIHGSGTHESLLRSLAGSPPHGWSVEVHGPVPDLTDRMAGFDLLMMPSRHEGLSLLAIEAALLALPIVATDAPGMREGLPPTHPWLARAGDPDSFAETLRHALENPASWADAARNAQAFARARFGVRTMYDGYDRLYRKILCIEK